MISFGLIFVVMLQMSLKARGELPVSVRSD